MSHHPDDRSPEDPTGDGPPRLDDDVVWAEIVANYGERPHLGPAQPAAEPGPEVEPGETRDLFDRAYLDSQLERQSRDTPELSSWDDEGHFVPPAPPPLPTLDPRRKAAWIGLFGSPALMLLGIVLGWTYPAWVMFVLVIGFVGGFGYLVATMPRTHGGDGPGDDGAVL